MRKLTVLAVAFVMLAAACSTKSNASGTSSSTAPSSAAATGVTARTIRVGITYPDLAAIRQIVNIDQGDYRVAYTTVIDQINAAGGIDGRKLVPYFAAVNPIGTDPAAQACTQLTEDDHVFVAVGFFQNDDALCYVHTHDTPVIGPPLTASQEAQADAPWFSPTLGTAKVAVKLLSALSAQGAFAGQRVAVIADANDQSEMNQIVLPELRTLKVDVVQTGVDDAPANDIQASYQRDQLIAQKFQSVGATLVVAVGNAGESWPKALQVNHSGYLPRIVATDANPILAYAGDKSGNSPAVLKGAITGTSAAPPAVTWDEPAMRKCVKSIQQAEPSAVINNPATASSSTPTTWVSAISACQYVPLLADILRAAGRDLTAASFQRAGDNLGSVSIPGFPTPLHYSPTSHDGNGPIYLETYDSATHKFDTQSIPY